MAVSRGSIRWQAPLARATTFRQRCLQRIVRHPVRWLGRSLLPHFSAVDAMVDAGRPRLFHASSGNDKVHPVTSRNDDESASRYAWKGPTRALCRASVGARNRDSTCTVVAGRTAARSLDRRRSSWFGQCVASSHLDRTKDGRGGVPMARDDVPWLPQISSR